LKRDDWTKILGWPGYTVYEHEIDEKAKRLKLGFGVNAETGY
jgi:hypothetical protein